MADSRIPISALINRIKKTYMTINPDGLHDSTLSSWRILWSPDDYNFNNCIVVRWREVFVPVPVRLPNFQVHDFVGLRFNEDDPIVSCIESHNCMTRIRESNRNIGTPVSFVKRVVFDVCSEVTALIGGGIFVEIGLVLFYESQHLIIGRIPYIISSPSAIDHSLDIADLSSRGITYIVTRGIARGIAADVS